MSADCSFLLNLSTYNATSNEMWIKEDIISPFSLRYMTSEFWIGLLCLVICLLFGTVYCVIFPYWRWYYPGYDMKQKLIKLRALRIEPLTKKYMKSQLETHVQYQIDIINLILNFAGVVIDNVEDFANIIFESPPKPDDDDGNPHCLLICVLCIVTYIGIYLFSAHSKDAYRSFVDVPCMMAYSDTCSKQYFEEKGKYCVFEFDLNVICAQNTFNTNITVYGDLQIAADVKKQQSKLIELEYQCGVRVNSGQKNINYRWLVSPKDPKNCKCCYTRHCDPFCGRCCTGCGKSCSTCWKCDSNLVLYLWVIFCSEITIIVCLFLFLQNLKKNRYKTKPYTIKSNLQNLEETALLEISTQ